MHRDIDPHHSLVLEDQIRYPPGHPLDEIPAFVGDPVAYGHCEVAVVDGGRKIIRIGSLRQIDCHIDIYHEYLPAQLLLAQYTVMSEYLNAVQSNPIGHINPG